MAKVEERLINLNSVYMFVFDKSKEIKTQQGNIKVKANQIMLLSKTTIDGVYYHCVSGDLVKVKQSENGTGQEFIFGWPIKGSGMFYTTNKEWCQGKMSKATLSVERKFFLNLFMTDKWNVNLITGKKHPFKFANTIELLTVGEKNYENFLSKNILPESQIAKMENKLNMLITQNTNKNLKDLKAVARKGYAKAIKERKNNPPIRPVVVEKENDGK